MTCFCNYIRYLQELRVTFQHSSRIIRAKKYLTFALLLILAATMAACGGTEVDTSEKDFDPTDFGAFFAVDQIRTEDVTTLPPRRG